MSEPRHAMIYPAKIEVLMQLYRTDMYLLRSPLQLKTKWWLEIVRFDCETEGDCMSNNASTIGMFDSPEEAQDFADEHYQNIGYEIPVLSETQFPFLSPPFRWVSKSTPYGSPYGGETTGKGLE